MLLRQHKFPDTYDERDKLVSADHDRIQSWDWDHAKRCWQKHLGTGPLAIGDWAKTASVERIMEFVKDALKLDSSVKWTGFRILGTVNRSNGYPVFSIQAFAKHPESKTKVYSGARAPNVKGGGPTRARSFNIVDGIVEDD